MKIKIFFTFIVVFGFFTSCENAKNKKGNNKQTVDYNNIKALDSLIKVTPHSKDTIFLGFTIGMNKSEYKSHIEKLRNKGKTISYSNSNRFTIMGNTFELGSGYTFKTGISIEKDKNILTGNGQYFLEPVYNKNENLMQLNIIPIEKWDQTNYGLNKPNWIKNKIEENSERFKNNDLKQALIEHGFLDKYDFIRQKGDLIIYNKNVVINYVDFKTLLVELALKEAEKEIQKEDSESVKF